MKNLNKFVAFALCLCMVFSMLAFTGAAEEENEAQAQADVRYDYFISDDGEAVIKKVENCPRIFYVPSTLGGCPVTSFWANVTSDVVEEVYFPESVDWISGGFQNCPSLRRVILPTALVWLDSFEGCASLSYIGTGRTISGCCVLPSKLYNLGDGAFKGCKSLTGILLPQRLDTIKAETFAGCTGLKRVVTYAEKINKRACADCGMIDGFMLLNVAKKVSRNAFENTKLGAVVYSGSTDHFNKTVKVTFEEGYPEGGLFALGADIRYKTSGKLSDLVDPRVTEYGGKFSTEHDYYLKIDSDGDTYHANNWPMGVEKEELHHPTYDYVTKEYGFHVPAYARIYTVWWQKLIRLFLFGLFWY